jgi:hypothetical protein
MPQTILPIFPKEATPINEVVSFSKREGTVWYFHGCFPVFSHGEEDYASFRMYTSQLVETGSAGKWISSGRSGSARSASRGM